MIPSTKPRRQKVNLTAMWLWRAIKTSISRVGTARRAVRTPQRGVPTLAEFCSPPRWLPLLLAATLLWRSGPPVLAQGAGTNTATNAVPAVAAATNAASSGATNAAPPAADTNAPAATASTNSPAAAGSTNSPDGSTNAPLEEQETAHRSDLVELPKHAN